MRMTVTRTSRRTRSQRKLDTLPDGPGVYLWKDAAGEVLYVGKAKRLRSRVRSYFAGDHDREPRSDSLLRAPHRRRGDHRGPADEAQSLLLENNLIKEYQPRFNVRLKDDKSYPSIAVTLEEPFPRVLVTRRRDIPGARYFGPYTDVAADAPLARRSSAGSITVRSCSRRHPAGAPRPALPRLSHRALPGARAWAGRPRRTTGR